MARDDQTGELPSTRTDEWRDVQAALLRAQRMAASAAQGVDSMRQQRPAPSPPGTGPPAPPVTPQARIRSLLATHFRLPAPVAFDLLHIAERYRALHSRLSGLNRQSFRMVTDAVANAVAQGGHGDVFGYVHRDVPIDAQRIFLNEAYFSMGGGGAPAPAPHSSDASSGQPRRAEVTADGAGLHVQQSLQVRASVILHEAAHLVFGAEGAVHRAINSGTRITVSSDDCSRGYTQIMTNRQATSDAYVWEKFALCVDRVLHPPAGP